MQATTLAPTAFGQVGALPPALGAQVPAVREAELLPALQLEMPPNFPVRLEVAQLEAISARVREFDFASTPAQKIALLGQEPTVALNRVLDGFLDRVTKAESPQIFKLVDALSDEVAKERIGELAEQILSAKPGLLDRVKGVFSKRALQQGVDRAYEELGKAARSKSKSLSDTVAEMERKLQFEMNRLNEELRQMDALKAEYRKALVSFSEEVVFLHNALAKARAQLPSLVEAAGLDFVRRQELEDAVLSLESVALSREALMTRMPAEQLIIRQLQSAGVSTLQELTVTMGDRFASIRMTLLGIHGANLVRGVQRLGQANAQLDNQLQEARAKLMGAAVSAAALAPGDNRLQQANNLKRVVEDTQNLQKIVEEARELNKAKFDEARATMTAVRQDLLALGTQITPGATVAAQSY